MIRDHRTGEVSFYDIRKYKSREPQGWVWRALPYQPNNEFYRDRFPGVVLRFGRAWTHQLIGVDPSIFTKRHPGLILREFDPEREFGSLPSELRVVHHEWYMDAGSGVPVLGLNGFIAMSGVMMASLPLVVSTENIDWQLIQGVPNHMIWLSSWVFPVGWVALRILRDSWWNPRRIREINANTLP